MNRQPHVDEILRRGVLAAGLLCASLAIAAPSAPAPAPVVGTFTGELSQAGPVYRLPQVQVIAYRKTELARMDRNERMRRTVMKAARPAV